MWGWHHGYGYAGQGLVFGLLSMLFWASLIGLVVWAVARLTRPSTGPAQPPLPPAAPAVSAAARDILDRRYANGEITSEQYSEMRRVLETGSPQ